MREQQRDDRKTEREKTRKMEDKIKEGEGERSRGMLVWHDAMNHVYWRLYISRHMIVSVSMYPCVCTFACKVCMRLHQYTLICSCDYMQKYVKASTCVCVSLCVYLNQEPAEFSPELVRPYPKASQRKANRQHRRKRTSTILTDTPEKQPLEEKKASSAKVKRKILTEKKEGGKRKGGGERWRDSACQLNWNPCSC